MRRLLLAAVLLGLLAAAPPAVAADRLDALAAELRERPLAIDPELGWLFDRGQRRRMLRALTDSPVPIYAAALPLLETDESGGDSERVAAALHRRLGRPGLYVTIDQQGFLDALAFEVPRAGARGYQFAPFPTRAERDPSFTPLRLERLVDRVGALPAGTTTEDRELRPLEPYAPTFSRRYDDDGASFGGVATGAGTVFGVLGLLVGGGLRAVESRRRRRELEEARRKSARAREAQRRREEAEARRRREAERRRPRRGGLLGRLWP